MRSGYILLHRQGITPDEWRNPRRTLAWIDLLTLVDYETCIVTVSYGFLSKRWRVSRSVIQRWLDKWKKDKRITQFCVQHCVQHCVQQCVQSQSTFFVENYAKYQKSCIQQPVHQCVHQRVHRPELSNTVSSIKLNELSNGNVSSVDDTSENKKICFDLYDGMVNTNDAEKTMDQKNPNRRSQKVSAWLKSVGQLKRIDGATDEQIAFVISWLFKSGKKNAIFWQKNIRSGATLREKWPQLVANCKEDYQKQNNSLNIPSHQELSTLTL